MLTVIISAVLVGAVLLVLWPRRPAGGPPGPTPLPLIGTAAFLGARTRDDQFDVLLSLPAQFGEVISFYAGGMYNVFMTGLETTRDVMSQKAANGRFAGSAQLELSAGRRRGLIVAEGERWRKHSSFVRSTLAEMLRSGELERLILTEVNELVSEVAAARAPVPVKSLFRWRYLNLCWSIITGQRLPTSEARRLTELFTLQMAALQNTWVDNRLLRALFPERSGFAAVLRYKEAVRSAFAAAVRNGGGGTFVAKMRAVQGDPLWRPETDEDLVMFFFDFMNAGCETTSSFCEWALVYLLRDPDMQRRLRREVAALPSPLSLAHRPQAPLLRAFEAEVMRRSSLTPAGVPHRALDDLQVGDFRVPAGTTLRYDIIGLHWDPALWPDPKGFNPDRFLRGGAFVNSENLVPYGIGLRRCTGEEFAEAYHFLMLASVLREMTIVMPTGAPPPSEDATIGLVRMCRSFDVIFEEAPVST